MKNPLQLVTELPGRLAGRYLLAQGRRFFEASRTNDALTLFRQAFDVYSRLQHQRGIADAAAHLATAHYYLGDFRESYRNAHLSFRISKTERDLLGMSRALTYMGNVCTIEGRLLRALALHRRSLRLAIEIGNRHSQIRARLNLADTLSAMRQYREAFHEVYFALEQFTPTEKNSRFYITAENSLGGMYRAVNQHELADDSYQSALQRARDMGDELLQATLLTNLGIGAAIRGKWSEAIENLQQSLDLKLGVDNFGAEATTRRVLGRCLEMLNRDDEATLEFERARSSARRVGNHEEEWRACSSIADHHLRAGRESGARIILEEALRLTERYGTPYDSSLIQRSLARIQLRTGNCLEAVALLEQAMVAEEGIWEDFVSLDRLQISILEDHIETHQMLQWSLVELGKVTEALEVAERVRARSLAEELTRRFGSSLSKAEAWLDLKAMKAIARETNTTILIYSLIPDPRILHSQHSVHEIFAWVVPPDANREITFQRTPAPLDLAQLLEQFLISISLEPSSHIEAVLLSLYELLIEPIAHALPDTPDQQITVVANDILLTVPFAALTDAHGSRLVEKHPISTVPSVRILHLLDEYRRKVRTLQSRGALIVGNGLAVDIEQPFWSATKALNPLPWAEREAVLIAAKLGASALVGKAATRPAVVAQMKDKQFLHFAAHGLFDPYDGINAYGALVLAPSADASPILTAEDVAGMHLSADLAVLSACESGQGRVTAEGLLGLPRAFLKAGVTCVMASLWKIADRTTSDLMESFYDEVASDPRANRSCALRRAMIRTMQRHPHPYDWAGFLMVGDPRADCEK